MFPTIELPEDRLQNQLDATLRRASDAEHDNAYALMILGGRCGSVFVPAVQALRDHPDVQVDDQARTLTVTASTSGLDAAVARIATSLDRAGYVPRWRNELLDLWRDDDLSVAGVERGVVRPLGILTKAVHLNAWSRSGHLWVARRSLTKPTDPGMWDTLVGGLVGQGEDPGLALERESFEEAGLRPEDIAQKTPVRAIAIMRRRLPEGLQREMVLTSECVLPADVKPENQDGESMTIDCLAPLAVLEMIERGQFTVEASLVILEDLMFRTTGKRANLGSIAA